MNMDNISDNTLRAAFEAHFRPRQGWCEEDLERGGRGHYVWRETQTAWNAYRAGYQHAIDASERECEAEASIEGIAQRCAARIRALAK